MANASQAFSKHYHSLTDDELLDLALKRQEFEADALAALDEELLSRGLDGNAVREYESWLHPQVEQEPESAEPADEQERAEADTPTELPADWFDTTADPGAITLSSARPKGVTVAALSFWAFGLFGFGVGVAIFLVNSNRTLTLFLIGAMGMAWGAAAIVSGFGLWQLKPWARRIAEVLCWINVVVSAASITVNATARILGYAIDSRTALSDIGGFLFGLLWVVYLRRADVRKVFAEAASREKIAVAEASPLPNR